LSGDGIHMVKMRGYCGQKWEKERRGCDDR